MCHCLSVIIYIEALCLNFYRIRFAPLQTSSTVPRLRLLKLSREVCLSFHHTALDKRADPFDLATTALDHHHPITTFFTQSLHLTFAISRALNLLLTSVFRLSLFLLSSLLLSFCLFSFFFFFSFSSSCRFPLHYYSVTSVQIHSF